MGKSKKHRRRRDSSSGSSEDGVNPKTLMKRIIQLEKQVNRRSRSVSRRRIRTTPSRSRSRSRVGSRNISRKAPSEHGYVNRDRYGAEHDNNRGDRLHVEPAADAVSGVELHSPCSQLSPEVRSVADACSAYQEQPNEELIIHNDIELPDPDLPMEILEVLGKNPEKADTGRFMLHEYLVTIWKHILTKGLKKEDFLKLINSSEIPANLEELIPPKLNPELGPLLRQQDKMTDGSHVEVQKQIGNGLCALGKGINLILKDVGDVIPMEIKVPLLASLSDSAQIFANTFHRVSVTRRNLLSPLLNKNVKDLVEKIPPSEFLFGSDLGEKIKTAKNVESLSKDLKLVKPSGFTSVIRRQNRGGGISQQRAPLTQTSLNLNIQRPGRRGETRPSRGLFPRINRWDGRREVQGTTRKDQRRRRD